MLNTPTQMRITEIQNRWTTNKQVPTIEEVRLDIRFLLAQLTATQRVTELLMNVECSLCQWERTQALLDRLSELDQPEVIT